MNIQIYHSDTGNKISTINTPELQGTHKQIKWANTIRSNFIAQLQAFEDFKELGLDTREPDNFVQAVQTLLINYPMAGTWISKFQGSIKETAVAAVLEFYRDELVPEKVQESSKNKGINSELISVKHNENNICEITYKNLKSHKTTTTLRKENSSKLFPNENLVNVNTDVYAFSYNSNVGENIHWVGNYKQNIWSEDISQEQKDAIKGDDKEVEVQPESTPEGEDGEIFHETFQKILACVKSDIPVYLVGPAGSGKNHTLEQVARQLNLEFHFTNSIQQEHKLTGFIDAGGRYHETEFYKAFINGGLFFLDEMDASIPEVLVLLNAAIANGYFEFPNGRAEAHSDFRVVAAGNTMGSGADEQYTGRLVLDQATLDRFAVIEFNYDIRIEIKVAKGNMELVNFVRDLREQSQKQGIRTTYSYRCISAATKLAGILSTEDIVLIAIVKGLDKDTIRTYRTSSENSYSRALKKIQGAV